MNLISEESLISKWEEFRRLAREGVSEECSNLLKKMELEDDDDDDEDLLDIDAYEEEEEVLSLTEASLVPDMVI